MPSVTDRPTTDAVPPGPAAGFTGTGPLTVLIVDDTRINLLVLEALLSQEGHRVVQAENGLEAVAAFERDQPDLILMDIMMPVMDGYEATRRIKARCGDRFVPVIFLTAITDATQLAACVEKGGDDFLTKPIDRQILLAKVNALNRVRLMHDIVQAQRTELARMNAYLWHEQEVTRDIYARVMRSEALTRPNVKHRLCPAAMMSGDLLLVASRPTGSPCALLGDFTGHGLAAAAGALPVAETFYAMVAKGFPLDIIAATINEKLHAILPAGIFCAACLVDMNPSEMTLQVWNGGIPEGLLYRPGLGIYHRLASRHLPLGLLDKQAFDATLDRYEVREGDQLYLYSDGLIEATDAGGAPFGQERLESYFLPASRPGERFESINRGLSAFCGQASQHDDIAILELTCTSLAGQTCQLSAPPTDQRHHARSWSVRLDLTGDLLKTLDPLTQLTKLLADFDGLLDEKEPFFMILAELVSNAIDHGLLGLDSALKAAPDGFAAYYERRAQALAHLDKGQISIHIEHRPSPSGSRIIIQVEDSGPGFDYHRAGTPLAANHRFSGRGIPLVRSLCEQVTYQGRGNRVQAVYVWT